MTDAEKLAWRNQIAATIGTPECQAVLKKIREQMIANAKNYIPSSNDPNGLGLHRGMGRLDAIDYLITLGQQMTKTKQPKEKKDE